MLQPMGSAKSRIQLSDWTTTTTKVLDAIKKLLIYSVILFEGLIEEYSYLFKILLREVELTFNYQRRNEKVRVKKKKEESINTRSLGT